MKFRSEALWRDGRAELHYRFLHWAEGLGLEATEPEGLSRVDFTFDYQLSTGTTNGASNSRGVLVALKYRKNLGSAD